MYNIHCIYDLLTFCLTKTKYQDENWSKLLNSAISVHDDNSWIVNTRAVLKWLFEVKLISRVKKSAYLLRIVHGQVL